MNLLLDACVWGGAVTDLRIAGHDAIWAGDWEKDPGDEEILSIEPPRESWRVIDLSQAAIADSCSW